MQNLLDNKLNKEIVDLLTFCNISPKEKLAWLTVLQDMTEEEKLELKKNLEEEAEYEVEAEEKSAKAVLTKLNEELDKKGK